MENPTNQMENKIAFYKEQISSIYYHFVRPKGEIDIKNCAVIYERLLCSLIYEMKNALSMDDSSYLSSYIYLCKLLYKLIAQTRDICNGKGERDLTYMMVYIWWKHFPAMGLRIFRALLFSTGENNSIAIADDEFSLHINTSLPYFPHINSYGCWKDVKYFCHYVRSYGSKTDNICIYAMIMLNQRIYNDYTEYNTNGTMPSLACKWVPRENSKHGWIFEKMAIQWVQATQPYILYDVRKTMDIDIDGMEDIDVSLVHVKAITKCKTIYRKVISFLTKLVDITETKKCEHRWSEIVPEKITIRDWECNKNAFFNIDNEFRERHNTVVDKDRRECAHNIKEHMYMRQMSPDTVLTSFVKSYTNRSFFTPCQFVKNAIHIIRRRKMEKNAEMLQNILYQTNLLNNRWEMFSKKCNTLDYFIPIVDASLSMRGEPLYNAIGMSCLIAEKSKIERRVMIMDNVPIWVNLDKCANFVEMVEILYEYTNKYTIANLLRTFDGLLNAIEISRCPPMENTHRSTDLVFVVFTNKDSFWKYENDMIHPAIMDKFVSANLAIPHIVYWNCGSVADENNVFPALSNTRRVSMVSGTNASLLDHFSFIGWGNLYNNHSVENMENVLSNSRYDEIDELFTAHFRKEISSSN